MRFGNLHTGERKAERSAGHIKGIWHGLGGEAGSRKIGLRRIEIAPEHFSTPVHEHGEEEETFFVLGGSGLLWQEGKTYAVSGNDCIVHRPQRGAHTLRAGADGLDVLAFGQRLDASLTALPRAGVAWSGARWLTLGGGEGPFEREAAVGPPACPEPSGERPANLVALSETPVLFEGLMRPLGRTAGAQATGLNHVTLLAGAAGAPAHCHSLEEELFVVLAGSGTLELWQRGEREEHVVVEGDVISRPPGTGVAHALRAGEDGMTYLAYGTREPADTCFYPQSGRVSLRGLGISFSSAEIDYL